jgi:hypothetical protein
MMAIDSKAALEALRQTWLSELRYWLRIYGKGR